MLKGEYLSKTPDISLPSYGNPVRRLFKQTCTLAVETSGENGKFKAYSTPVHKDISILFFLSGHNSHKHKLKLHMRLTCLYCTV